MGTAATSTPNRLPERHQFQRVAFQTNRELDFLAENELTAQTGHQPREWPLVLLKELVDNALDACEEGSIAPRITVKVDEQGVSVTDNGPGIAPTVVAAVTDFSVRVSSREAYVAPDRGRQGNALKTILAMPFVLSNDKGLVRIEAKGLRHEILLDVDRVRQRPRVEYRQTEVPCTEGTSIFVAWADSPRSIEENANKRFLQKCVPRSPRSILVGAKQRFLQIAEDYTWLNPHLSLTVDWLGERSRVKAGNPTWPKWKPSDPTDPNWYSAQELERLIAANLAHDADRSGNRTVREFVSEFRGLSSTIKVKSVLEAVGLARARLSDLAGAEGIDKGKVAELLAAMKRNTRPVKPPALGIIGSDHLAARFKSAGAEMKTFKYRKVTGATNGIPFVVEAAFAWSPNATQRRIITGVNWSPGILNPFRQLGIYGKSLDTILEEQRVGPDEPTVVFLHIACPKVAYSDRGKSSVIVEA